MTSQLSEKWIFFKPPGCIAFDSSNLGETWRRLEQQFRTFFTACELNNKPKEVQVAILLHTAMIA